MERERERERERDGVTNKKNHWDNVWIKDSQSQIKNSQLKNSQSCKKTIT